MSRYTFNLMMTGSGYEQATVPRGYSFMSVINNTDNTLYVHGRTVSQNKPEDALLHVPAYTSMTIPIPSSDKYTFFYVDGGGVDTKKAIFYFTTENLQINSLIRSNITGTVTLGSDGVGLARQDKQDDMIDRLQGILSATQSTDTESATANGHLQTIITELQNVVAAQQETNTKLQTLIDQGGNP